ncbi:MAG: SNF2 family helicase [Lachnospiraceae bacterium]|nr:SNF2 family helicase [Lachnospiraceae bacterium]
MEWKDRFSPSALQAGMELYEKGNVSNLRKNERGFEAQVHDKRNLHVRIGISRGRLASLYCDCPASQSWCRHVAAALFAADASDEEERLFSVPDEKPAADVSTYFQMDRIRDSVEFSSEEMGEGRRLIQTGSLTLSSMETRYISTQRQMVGTATGDFKASKYTARVQMTFTEDKIISSSCSCPECVNKYYFAFLQSRKKCPHLAGLVLLTSEYLKKHEIGDATDKAGDSLIRMYQDARAAAWMEAQEAQPNTLELIPRVQRTVKDYVVDFRISVRGGRSFVIKNLSAFANLVREGKNALYGSSTVLNHNIRSFTPQAQRYVLYISETVCEEREFERRKNTSLRPGDPMNFEFGGQIMLSGKRMDDFYDLAVNSGLEYEEKNGETKKKRMLSCREGHPAITMKIHPYRDANEVFSGVDVSAELPDLIYGMNALYYIDETHLNRIEADFAGHLRPLFSQSKGPNVDFRVGRLQLPAFYYTVLPGLREYLTVDSPEEEEIQQHLLPEVQFVFGLDAEDDFLTCRAKAIYGQCDYSLMESLTDSSENNSESFRDRYQNGYRDEFRESEAFQVVTHYFPDPDLTQDEFRCERGGDAMYLVLSEGVNALMKYGEVQTTERFRRLRVIQKVNFDIGISIKSGLLSLNISSEELSMEELLDALSSYRRKKTFHRLKNGDFLALNEETYGMVYEMLTMLQVSPKEFVAGKMQIPAYRALYLDKMLEEYSGVYAQRDEHFQKLIRNFDALREEEYPIPQSLEGVLRGYQKKGFQWLRILRAGHFGGILADDMGLGKTLQVIAMLLSLKEEGNAAHSEMTPSIIITPASLIYNWGEEFARYAPSLSVCIVSGSVEERHRAVSSLRSPDRTWDVLITSYDLLKRDIDVYEGISFDCEVIDEAQYIKNHQTAAAKSVKLITAGTRFALTGTPIENRLSELWSIFDYLMPGFLYRYEEFRTNFEVEIMAHPNEEASVKLKRLVSPFILRRLKQDVLTDLPDKIEEVRFMRLGEEQQKLYDAQVVHMRQMLSRQKPSEFRKNRLLIFREITRLRQICCDPSLCFEGYRGGSAKLEACLDLVTSAIEGGHRLLLFSQFTSMLSLIREAFEEHGISYYEITGDTPKEKRISLVREFNQNDVQVFLISLKAGGTGLNLTGADVVVHYDPWWNLAVQNQATDRAHRIGQEKIVTVYRLIAKGTIEEKILKLQENKQNLADQIISGEMSSLSNMTQEELLELLG